MSKFTPGPWRLEQPRGTSKLAQVWTDVGPITINTGIATLANAQLIAAAPDLYAALQAIRPLFDNDSALLKVYAAEIEQCETALAKAQS